MFVASRNNPRITKATLDHEYIVEFGIGRFTYLTAVAVDGDDNVYTTDEWLHQVSVFDSKGTFLKTWGEPGSGEGQLNGPSGLAFDADGNILIVNSLNSRVQKFSRDGQYISGFGQKGNGPGEMDLPWGIAIDNNGCVYIADWNNHGSRSSVPTGSTCSPSVPVRRPAWPWTAVPPMLTPRLATSA